MKIIKFIFAAGFIFIIVAAIAIYFLLNIVVEKGIEKVGSKITQTNVTVEKVSITPFTGVAEIQGFEIANPDGFHTFRAFALKKVRVDINLRSIVSNCVIFEDIAVHSPRATYEASLNGSNIGQIKSNVMSFIDGMGKKESDSSSKQEKPPKMIRIDRFLFEEGTVDFSTTMLKGESLSVPLPEILLQDIGKESNGVTPAEVLRLVIVSVTDSVLKVVSDSGVLKRTLEESTKKLGERVKEKAGKMLGGFKKILGKE